MISLELSEAMLDRTTCQQIFLDYVDQHLFDRDLGDAEFITEMWLRQSALEAASARLLTLLEDEDHASRLHQPR